MRSGFYCSACGAMFNRCPEGIVTCARCGHLGLRCFDRPIRRVSCTVDGCTFTGFDDGGVNDDLGRHRRREHAEEPT
jgi:hypothetical protein